MVLKSTKKPRGKFSGILPALVVLLCGGIIFIYGKSFSERVLELSSFNGPNSPAYNEGALEQRVKGYEITEQKEIREDKVGAPEKEEEALVVEEETEEEGQITETKEEDSDESTREKEEEEEEEVKEEDDKEANEQNEAPEKEKGEKEEEEYIENDQGDYEEEEDSPKDVDDKRLESAEYDDYENAEEGDEKDHTSSKTLVDDEYEDAEEGDEKDHTSSKTLVDDDYEDAEEGDEKDHTSSKTLVDDEYEDVEEGDEKDHTPPKSPSEDEYEYEEEMGTATESKDDDEYEPAKDGDDSGEKFLRVLEDCRDLICIQEAHKKYPRSSKMFNFPHFMIIGFQKAATTSLKKYLEKHSHISKPRVKEPNFFPYDCHEKPPEKCSRANTTAYITKTLHLQDYIDSKGEMAMFEASTHIVRAGHNLAPRMAKLMPWLKIIVQFREPISRAASMMIHNKDVNGVGCLMKAPMGHCLLHHSQITEMPTKRYHPITYTEAIKPWIESFPKEQIHVIQYEALTDDEREASELTKVRKFLNVSTDEPKGGLGLANSRRFRINPEGWQLQRSQYEELVDIVKPDVESLVELLYDHDLIDDTETWKQIWQQHWDENMKTCDNEKNRCTISLSR